MDVATDYTGGRMPSGLHRCSLATTVYKTHEERSRHLEARTVTSLAFRDGRNSALKRTNTYTVTDIEVLHVRI